MNTILAAYGHTHTSYCQFDQIGSKLEDIQKDNDVEILQVIESQSRADAVVILYRVYDKFPETQPLQPAVSVLGNGNHHGPIVNMCPHNNVESHTSKTAMGCNLTICQDCGSIVG